MKKRIISMLLVVAMVLALVPTVFAVEAAETETVPHNYVGNGSFENLAALFHPATDGWANATVITNNEEGTAADGSSQLLHFFRTLGVCHDLLCLQNSKQTCHGRACETEEKQLIHRGVLLLFFRMENACRLRSESIYYTVKNCGGQEGIYINLLMLAINYLIFS